MSAEKTCQHCGATLVLMMSGRFEIITADSERWPCLCRYKKTTAKDAAASDDRGPAR